MATLSKVSKDYCMNLSFDPLLRACCTHFPWDLPNFRVLALVLSNRAGLLLPHTHVSRSIAKASILSNRAVESICSDQVQVLTNSLSGIQDKHHFLVLLPSPELEPNCHAFTVSIIVCYVLRRNRIDLLNDC